MLDAPDWTVLLIGGGSAAGKTTLAEALAARFEARYVDLDLFWIVLEASVPPDVAPDLHLLAGDEVYERLPADELVERHWRVASYVGSAIEPVIAQHDVIGRRAVIEGCWLLPEFVTRTTFAGHKLSRAVRSIFLHEPSPAEIEARKHARTPEWMASLSTTARSTHIEMEARFGERLAERARALGLPVLESRPFETLEARSLDAIAES